MPSLYKLEQHLGRFAIPGLIRYVVALNALVFLLALMNPGYVSMLVFNRDAIAAGELWRVVSWLFVPGTNSLIWMYCYLSFTWWAGDSLEATWGTFRLNIYFFLGVLGGIVSGFLFGIGSSGWINLSLLLAAATLAPNLQILFMYLIPMRLKWVALIALIIPIYAFIFGGLATQAAIAVCLVNYLAFFGRDLFQQAMHNRAAMSRRAKFAAASIPAHETLHRCITCGCTEASNPDTEFRVSADGNEYCAAHLPAKKA
ncbi:MAG: hypothetical protein ACREKL_15990 [Chthoniobacterales bacterium]